MTEVQKKIYHRPRGMRDFFEAEIVKREEAERIFFEVTKKLGFERIEVPYLEEEKLFLKSLGDDSDVVRKEMYSVYRDKEPLGLALRPEFTAGVIRAYLENGLTQKPQPVLLASSGVIFRHDRPQRKRFRDPWQLNLEIVGSSETFYDALVIFATFQFLAKIKINQVFVKTSHLGCLDCQPRYLLRLKEFLEKNSKFLCPECQRRKEVAPLRTLDCKNPDCQRLYSMAPSIHEHLCKKCSLDFEMFLSHLADFKIDAHKDKTLVRGFDYYTGTVFEVFDKEETLALAGGGRYDNLVELYGGPKRPAVGIGIGLDRVLEIATISYSKNQQKRIALIALSGQTENFFKENLEKFTNLPVIIVDFAFSNQNISQKLRQAAQKGAEYALILGEDELKKEEIIIKNFQDGSQKRVPLQKLFLLLQKIF